MCYIKLYACYVFSMHFPVYSVMYMTLYKKCILCIQLCLCDAVMKIDFQKWVAVLFLDFNWLAIEKNWLAKPKHKFCQIICNKAFSHAKTKTELKTRYSTTAGPNRVTICCILLNYILSHILQCKVITKSLTDRQREHLCCVYNV